MIDFINQDISAERERSITWLLPLCLRHKQTKLRSMSISNPVSEYQPWSDVSYDGWNTFFSCCVRARWSKPFWVSCPWRGARWTYTGTSPTPHRSPGSSQVQQHNPHALQRQNTGISKQVFPEKEYRGLSPNFHIHASVSDLYIPTIGLPILLEEICRPILGLYKSLTDTWMLKLGLRPRYSQKRNT